MAHGRRQRGAGLAPAEDGDEEEVERDVRDRRDCDKEERALRVPHAAQYGGAGRRSEAVIPGALVNHKKISNLFLAF